MVLTCLESIELTIRHIYRQGCRLLLKLSLAFIEARWRKQSKMISDAYNTIKEKIGVISGN